MRMVAAARAASFRVRRAVRWLIPSGLLGVWRRARRWDHIWRGVYPTFDMVPRRGSDFSSALWIRNSGESTRRLLDAPVRHGAVPSDVQSIGEHRTLVTAAALIAARQGSVRVLDFGGGFGDAFIYLRDAIPDPNAIDYHVVELPATVAAASGMLRSFPAIRFHDSFPRLGNVDIVYANGALQCVPDYTETLRRFADAEALLVILIELPAGAGPTFASAQTNLGGSFPVWFFELREVIGLMESLGYRLLMDSRAAVGYSLLGLPPERRITDFHTLIFRRETATRSARGRG
jgi:putative methyltransferase (TIGR04325 family)